MSSNNSSNNNNNIIYHTNKRRRRVQTEIVKVLLNHPDIDINIQGKDGITPLILASKSNDVDAVKLLLEYGGKDTIDFELKVAPPRNTNDEFSEEGSFTTRSNLQTAKDVTTNDEIKSLIDECVAYQKKKKRSKAKGK